MREKGFYWVYWVDEWLVAQWTGVYWSLPGMDWEFKNEELYEILEIPINLPVSDELQ